MAIDPRSRSFAARLNHLFETVHPPRKSEFSYAEVAAGVAAKGHEISASYVWQLRTGERENPTLRHMRGLAAFFGVPASYFLEDAVEQRVNEQLQLIASLRDAGVQNVALRATGVSARGLAAIEGMIDQIREIEALPPAEPVEPNDEIT